MIKVNTIWSSIPKEYEDFATLASFALSGADWGMNNSEAIGRLLDLLVTKGLIDHKEAGVVLDQKVESL